MNKHQTIEDVGDAELTVEEKVLFLKQPGVYPYHDENVIVKETHMSWVFLVNGVVYKLKKPVLNRLFDFRTLEARLVNCKEEIRLNRALAGDLYLGIVPLCIDESGKLGIEKRGKIVDWLVKIKRLPEEGMLDFVIRTGRIEEKELRPAADMLANFYKTSHPVSMNPAQYIRKIEGDVFFNYNELANPLFEFPLLLLRELTAGQMAFLTTHQYMFEERLKKGKIIETHGDLRPEHICVGQQPAIIDRLEFNRDLRIMDIAEELAFLGMECEMMGDPMPGEFFLDEYIKMADDPIPMSLTLFYKIKRACLRAYLVARHKEEVRYKDDPQWLTRANAYLELAEEYHQQLAG